MTLRHMRIFLSVCEHGYNTTRAAEAMHMTQPAVSLTIRELEQYYGVALFERIGRRLKITDTGKMLREYASHICELFDDLEKGLRNQDALGTLRVGASVTIGSQFLPSYVKTFYCRYPGTEVKVLVAPSEQLEQMVLSNELDFALIEGVPHSDSLIAEGYMEDHLTVICPAGGDFRQGQQLSIEELKEQKLLLREHGSGTREVFERAVESAGFSVSPAWEAMSTRALVNAVISGLGIAVVPYRMVRGLVERGLIVEVGVEGLNFQRRFQLIYHRKKHLTASAKAFMDLCRNYEKEYPLPEYDGQ